MKIKVKLYGTLSHHYPGYRHAQGMEVEIPDGATVRDLLAFLEIAESQGAAVAMAGRILHMDDALESKAPLHVFQAIHGG